MQGLIVYPDLDASRLTSPSGVVKALPIVGWGGGIGGGWIGWVVGGGVGIGSRSAFFFGERGGSIVLWEVVVEVVLVGRLPTLLHPFLFVGSG